jgi:hypothetical protein
MAGPQVSRSAAVEKRAVSVLLMLSRGGLVLFCCCICTVYALLLADFVPFFVDFLFFIPYV